MKNNKHFCIEANKEKLTFYSEKEVERFIKFNKDKYEHPLHQYYCDFCCGWHLTSHYNKKYKPKGKDIIEKYNKLSNIGDFNGEKVDYILFAEQMDLTPFTSQTALKKYLNEHQKENKWFSNGDFRNIIYKRYNRENNNNKS